MLEQFKQRARRLRTETFALYLAVRDPRTPWYAKALVGGIVAYLLSPIDLIPDFVPVIGYLDDLILIPLGISAALRLIPDTVLNECRARAGQNPHQHLPLSRFGAALIGGFWLAAALIGLLWVCRTFGPGP